MSLSRNRPRQRRAARPLSDEERPLLEYALVAALALAAGLVVRVFVG